jgi:hypothetical protein
MQGTGSVKRKEAAATMPCENVHDGLPGYQQVYSLRRMAAAVIRIMPRTERPRRTTQTTRKAEARAAIKARRAEAGRQRRAETATPEATHSNAPSCLARPNAETTREPRALPRSPHRAYDESALSAERLREHLRR